MLNEFILKYFIYVYIYMHILVRVCALPNDS